MMHRDLPASFAPRDVQGATGVTCHSEPPTVFAREPRYSRCPAAIYDGDAGLAPKSIGRNVLQAPPGVSAWSVVPFTFYKIF